MSEGGKPALLVLASTYPRWQGDPEPGFVHELCKRLTDYFEVTVLGPHAPGAKTEEILDGVVVKRYRYAPQRLETLVNDGGIITNLRQHWWKWALVPGFMLSMLWAAWTNIRRDKPQVIHAHWLIPQGLSVALLGLVDRGVPPFVVTSHGADLFALKGPGLRVMKAFVAARAGAVTVVSAAMRKELAHIVPDPSLISVQPMGVDLVERFTPDPSVQRSAGELLFVGRLVEKKGLPNLIKAMPRILAARPDVVLTVAGFGPDAEACRSLTVDLGLTQHVRFLGAVQQPELAGLYRRAALLAAPFVEARGGDQEGLGLVLVEALGCGCPVVTTRIPAVKDVFGGTWPDHTAEPGSSDSLAHEILRVLAGQSAACDEVASGLPSLRERFDWSPVAKGYAQALSYSMRAGR
jgi:glycosyltransferase involved in cell wall biosynthesis